MRTSMRRHILSSRRGGPIVAERNGSLYPSRYASIRTSRELTLFGGSVHRMRSVFSVNLGRCDLPSGLSSLRVDQVRIAQSPYVRSEAIGQKKPWPQSHFSLGSSLLCSGIFTSSLCRFALLHRGSLSKPPAALGADGRCRVARRSLRSPIGGARAPKVCGPRPPPPVSWRSFLRGRLSSLRGV